MNIRTTKTNNPLLFGLAMVAGVGIVAMIVAMGIGVIQGEAADSSALGLLFLGGLVLMITGIGAWFGLVQPFKHFDDINEPKDTGHHAAHESHDEHALTVVDDEGVVEGDFEVIDVPKQPVGHH